MAARTRTSTIGTVGCFAAFFTRKISGFTLLEVLVTFAISAVLFTGLASLTGSMLKGWDRSTALLEDQSAIFNAVDRMAEEISGSIPLHAYDYDPEAESQEHFTGFYALFTGTPNLISIVRPAIGFETRHDLNRVSYFLERAGRKTLLVRRSQVLFPGEPDNVEAPATRTVVAEFNGSMAFEYGNGIVFSGQYENANVRPRMVRIRFTLDGFPDRVFTKIATTLIEPFTYCQRTDENGFSQQCQLMLSNRI